MTRLPQFDSAEVVFKGSLLELRPDDLERDLTTVADAIRVDVSFEPFQEVGDVRRLLNAAANLFHFVEEYERIHGSLILPPH